MENAILVNLYEVKHASTGRLNTVEATEVIAKDATDVQKHFAPLQVFSCIIIKEDIVITESEAYGIHEIIEQDITLQVQASKRKKKQ